MKTLETINEIKVLGTEQNTCGVASACICLLQSMANEIELGNKELEAIENAKHDIWESLDDNMGGYYATPEAIAAMKVNVAFNYGLSA